MLAVPSDSIETPRIARDALVLDLRRRWSRVKRAAAAIPGVNLSHLPDEESHGMEDEDPSRAWRGSTASLQSQALNDDDSDLGILALDDDETEGSRSVFFH